MIYQAGKESDHQKSLIEQTAVSSRIITVRFYPRFKNTTVIQVYAQQSFYNQLHATFDTCNRHNVVMVIGDSANTKVGDDNKDMKGTMGKHGLGSIDSQRLAFSSQEHTSHTEQLIKQRHCAEERKIKLST